MYNNRKTLLLLIRKFLKGKSSTAETAFLDYYYNFLEQETDLTSHLKAEDKKMLEADMEKAIWAIVDAGAPAKRIRLWPRIAVAASILFILSAGLFFFRNPKAPKISSAQLSEERMPAKKGITLTLANGKQINLSVLNNGQQKTSDGILIRQQKSALTYQNEQQVVVWHTLTNNSASVYALTLNDGTEVKLDMASSITYPTAFKGNERKVTVTGQTYFKVRHNANAPFRIQVQHTLVEDIGTEFNIDAYQPTIRTTLVEGAASVSLGNKKVMLAPGVQAISSENSLYTETADIESVTGWLQDKFVFSHEPLESILLKVERIYDVRFSWQDESLKKQKLNGLLSRSKKLSTVLNYLRKTAPVDFVIKGRQIEVIRKKQNLNK